MTFQIASAPVSFGIFGAGAVAHAPQEVASAIAAAGFGGAELGPPGLFGSPAETAELFATHNLEIVGAYAGLNLVSDDSVFDADLVALRLTCQELREAAGSPFVILADEGDEATRHNVGRSVDDPLQWTSDQWRLAAERVERLVEEIVGLGLTASFHPHVGTYIENERDIETLLDRTSVNLTLDTGHFLFAGVEPNEALRRFAGRINHIHCKDIRVDRRPAAEQASQMDMDDWWGDISSPLGEGDVDMVSFVRALRHLDIPWVVIEQDRDPAPPGSLHDISRAELANRRWLEEVVANGT